MLWILWLTFSLVSTNLAHAQSAGVMPTPVLVDRDMTPAAGATLTIAVARLMARLEDRFIPLTIVEDSGRLRRGANAAYRLAKLTFFDDPQENWFRVANHEVFGHGGRLRELFDGRIHYQLPAPPPYGRGGGATIFEFDHAPTVEEVLAVSAGGMEANYIAARALAQDGITPGRWHYRDARRYRYDEYDTIRYIRGTHDLEKAGHDVGDFIRIYNDLAADVGEKRLTARALRRSVLASFANPMLAYSYYSTYISYVWLGKADSPVPMIPLGATRYLPMARFHLTPFGTEFTIDNTFVRDDRFYDVRINAGQTIGARTWSLGLQGTRLASIRGWSIDGEATIWHVPEWGEAFAATAHRTLAERGGRALAVVVQGGFKTNGYVAGERLRQGAIVRVGAALIPTSRRSP